MKTRVALVLAATALSTGCAAAGNPRSLPDQIYLDRTSTAHVDVGFSIASYDELMRILPRSLARHGYFIIETRQRTAGYMFVTDWVYHPANAEGSLATGQRARTRLVVDTRKRGARYAVTIYAVSYFEDDNGEWREAPGTVYMKKHVRDVSTTLTLAAR